MDKFNEKNGNAIKWNDLGSGINFETKKGAVRRSITLISILAAAYVFIKKIFRKKIKTNLYFFDGISPTCRQIKENAQNWRALDIIYNYKYGSDNKIADYWLDIYNAQAVRNRLKIVKHLLGKKIRDIAKDNNGKVRIASIASGSAQGIIELMGEMKKEGIEVSSVLIDRDPTAHDHAKNLAQKCGVRGQISFYRENASFIEKVGATFRPQIVEMVGFLEYRNDFQTARLMNMIFGILEEEGVFFSSQIAPNLEMVFLRQVIDWPMIYRTPSQFEKIIKKTDFLAENCYFYWEPFKIHFVIECKKS